MKAERNNITLVLLGGLVITYAFWALAVWAPWIPARGIANIVLGVDMAEAIKFLPGIRSGHIHVWREAFLLPQLTLSVIMAAHAWQRRWSIPSWLRVGLQFAAFVVALSMLPPPWSPALLRAPEWRTQVIFIIIGVLMAVASPVLRYIPARVMDALLALLGMTTAAVIGSYLQLIWPEFIAVYHHPLPFGAGIWALGLGATSLLILAILGLRANAPRTSRKRPPVAP